MCIQEISIFRTDAEFPILIENISAWTVWYN